MFLSPAMSQLVLAFIAQSSSSHWRIWLNSSESWSCKLKRKALGLTTSVFRMPRSLAASLLFFQKILSKTSLFHCMAFIVNSWMALSKAFSLQAPRTRSWNAGWWFHIGWKRKGLSPLLGGGSVNFTNSGQWSELMQARWETLAKFLEALNSNK